MSKITIYLDDELAKRVRQAADDEGMAVSKWIARTLADRTLPHWPREIMNLAGSWADEDITRPVHGQGIQRESL